MDELEQSRTLTSAHLTVGATYTRKILRERFSIVDASINNGVFRPRGFSSIWLFVTRSKTSDRVQYFDELTEDILTWDSQTEGRPDRLIYDHHRTGDEIVVFYRESKFQYPGAAFRFEGTFEYVSHSGQRPARFTFRRTAAI